MRLTRTYRRALSALAVLAIEASSNAVSAQEVAPAASEDQASVSAQPVLETQAAVSTPSAPVSAAPAPASPEQSVVEQPAQATAPQPAVQDAPSAQLEALLAETMTEQNKPPKLEFYGFADFEYRQWTVPKSSTWRPLFPDHAGPQFIAGNLNLYMKGNLAEKWHSLAEVRFHFAPAGNQVPSGQQVTDPTAPAFTIDKVSDPVEFGRSFQYGFIQIYRVHIDYNAHPLLNIRAGRFLTPYGVWNVDHGSPVLIDVTKPYIIGDALFPESQTGFEIYGSTGVRRMDAGYHLTLSNGRGPIEQVGDLDRNKALGGRVWLRANTRRSAEVTWGGSFYTGNYTDKRFVLEDPTTKKTAWISWEKYKELSFGTDLRVRYKGLTSVTEVISQQRVWNDDARGIPAPGVYTTSNSRNADQVRWGAYSILGWRFDWYGVMPFGMAQYYSTGNKDAFAGAGSLFTFGGGVNARVVPSVVLKASFSAVLLQNAVKGSPASDPLFLATSQVAWAF